MLSAGRLDPDNPETVSEFFQRIFDVKDTDAQQIQRLRKALDYPEVAKRFRMIDEATIEVIEPEYGTPEERQRVQTALERLRKGAPESRLLLREAPAVDGPGIRDPSRVTGPRRPDSRGDGRGLRVAGGLQPGDRHRRNHDHGP